MRSRRDFLRGVGKGAASLSVLGRAGVFFVSRRLSDQTGPDFLDDLSEHTGGAPNILWIVLDALRAESLSCYGYDRETSPFLDSLAARGVLFENHYAQGTWTFPSVPSYMAGRYFPVNCMHPNGSLTPRIRPEAEKLLPARLAEAGYDTALFTAHPMVSHVSPLGRAFGRTHTLLGGDPAAKTWLGEVVGEIAEGIRALSPPFFAYLHLLDTHAPHDAHAPSPAGEEWMPGNPDARTLAWRTVEETESPFDDLEKEQLRGLYDTSIRRADDSLGALMGLLDAAGALDNTVIVVGSDHGEALGEDGRTVGHGYNQDEVLQVPLILCGPNVPAGIRVGHLTENVDIAPTLCHLAGLPPQTGFDGECLPMLSPSPKAGNKTYVFAKNERFDRPPHMILRTRTHKYEFHPEQATGFLLKAPDSLRNRRYSDEKAPAAMMEAVLRKTFLAAWNEYSRLPAACEDIAITGFSGLDAVPLSGLSMREAFKAAKEPPDYGVWMVTAEGVLVGVPGRMGLRELALSHLVPAGTYRVYARLVSFFRPGQIRRLRAEVRIGGESERRSLEFLRDMNIPTRTAHTEAGVHVLPNGTLAVRLSLADADSCTAISGFRLVPEEGDPAEESPERTREQLHALGYL